MKRPDVEKEMPGTSVENEKTVNEHMIVPSTTPASCYVKLNAFQVVLPEISKSTHPWLNIVGSRSN